MAVVSGNKDIVELLISKGSDVTVEIMSLAAQRGNTEFVELLHEHGADE